MIRALGERSWSRSWRELERNTSEQVEEGVEQQTPGSRICPECQTLEGTLSQPGQASWGPSRSSPPPQTPDRTRQCSTHYRFSRCEQTRGHRRLPGDTHVEGPHHVSCPLGARHMGIPATPCNGLQQSAPGDKSDKVLCTQVPLPACRTGHWQSHPMRKFFQHR